MSEAVKAIDGIVEYFAASGLSEEGGGLALYPHTKRLVEARGSLAAALKATKEDTDA
jgi:hypothetical protein